MDTSFQSPIEGNSFGWGGVKSQSDGRVLDGQIRRGMGETIHAVIWLCDLRGFTDLSERLPRDALMALLNGYFGPMCEAVEANGGEVLKFIGDAMLAIFPVAGEPASACAKALAAAHTAEATFAAENARRWERVCRPSPMALPCMWAT